MTLTDFKKTDFYRNSDFIPDFNDKITQCDDWCFLASKWDIWRTLPDTAQPSAGIPKIIHQVWIGGELPDKYHAWTDSWKKSGWEYHLWDEQSLLAIFTPEEAAWYNATANVGPKSDIARYKVLAQFGGIYCDTDFECIKPFDDIVVKSTLFAGVIFDTKPEIAGGIAGSIPAHPLIVQTLRSLIEKPHTGTDYNDILDKTGPAFFTRSIFQNKNLLMPTDVFFPTHYLYPLPNYKAMTTVSLKKTKKQYLKPVSYAIHYWEVSWAPGSSFAIKLLKKIVKKVIFYEYWKK